MDGDYLVKIHKPYAFCCNASPDYCDCAKPDHGTALYDATPAEEKELEFEDALSFCYALVAPGVDANKLITLNPSIADRAQRKSRTIPYDIMMQAIADAG
jgi:hypothetical protein